MERESVKQDGKKITELKQKIKPKQTKPVLSDPDVKKQQEELHRKFVNITIYKASNYFAFISKKYYISKLLAKVSKKNQHQYIQKHKSSLLNLTPNTVKNVTLK